MKCFCIFAQALYKVTCYKFNISKLLLQKYKTKHLRT